MVDDRRAAHAAIVTLSAMRIGIGALAWASPASTMKLFGMPNRADAAYPLRLFGIRDVVVGTATLRAPRDRRRAWVAVGLLCDAADGTAAVIGRRDGSLPATTSALFAVPAAAVGLGVWLLGRGAS